jgi:hypothetical protein
MKENIELRWSEGVCTILFLAQKSNSPTLCTVVTKKFKASSFVLNRQIRIFSIHNKQNPPNLIQLSGNKIKEQENRAWEGQNTNKMRDYA